MQDSLSAQTAHHNFNGANIFDSCNIMRIDFSNMNELTIKSDNDQRWDYTRTPAPAPTQQRPNQNQGQLASAPNGWVNNNDHNRHINSIPNGGVPTPVGNFGTQYGNPNQGSGTGYYQSHQYQYPQINGMVANGMAQQHYPQHQHIPGQFRGHYDSRLGRQPDQMGYNVLGSTVPQMVGGFGGPDTPVVCCSNLNSEKTNPDDLFILFGVYGDVQRVKILYEKHDTALIEFATVQQAMHAIKFLNNQKLFGKEIKCKASRFNK